MMILIYEESIRRFKEQVEIRSCSTVVRLALLSFENQVLSIWHSSGSRAVPLLLQLLLFGEDVLGGVYPLGLRL